MTMVIAAAWRHFALMVSDRLVTLNRPGSPEHDPLANKTVIFISADAVLIFGYTGSAYLAGTPTDQWIAQVLWGAPILPNNDGIMPMIGSRRRGARGLNQVVRALRQQLRTTRHGSSVTIAATGFRQRRGRFIPVLISFSGKDGSFPLATLAMRPPRTNELNQLVIGMRPSKGTVEAVHAKGGSPGPMSSEEGAWYAAETCAEVVRRTAKENPSVGPHVMKVIIPTSRRPGYGTAPWQRRVICQFSPRPDLDGKQPTTIAYGPWVVTDYGLQPASVMAGMGVTRNFRGWKVELSQKPSGREGSSFGVFAAQTRKPMPR